MGIIFSFKDRTQFYVVNSLNNYIFLTNKEIKIFVVI